MDDIPEFSTKAAKENKPASCGARAKLTYITVGVLVIAILGGVCYKYFVKSDRGNIVSPKDEMPRIVRHYASVFMNVDAQYKAIIKYGRVLRDLDLTKVLNPETITVRNPDFWLANMEMSAADPSIPMTCASLYALKGNLNRAKNWVFVGAPGMAQQHHANFNYLWDYLKAVQNSQGAGISRGVKYHDKGDYSKAIEIYNEVIENFPLCVLAYYEKSFSMLMMDKDGSESEREELYSTIRDIDPFYFEAYQGSNKEVLEKMRILVSEVMPFLQLDKAEDSYKKFAYGCEKMGIHDFAAQAFLKLMYSENSEEMMVHFFYNLKQLGLGSLVDRSLKGDLPIANGEAWLSGKDLVKIKSRIKELEEQYKKD
ncbi:hypothetical protein KKF70_06330 [bacterium]|nr:hypothetical protein [bacterium]